MEQICARQTAHKKYYRNPDSKGSYYSLQHYKQSPFTAVKISYETEQERLHLISFTGSIISLYIAWADGGYRESIEDLASVLDELYR